MPFQPRPTPAPAAPLRLVRPALAGVPDEGPGAPVALDEAQRAAVERAVSGADPALLVLGAPGTGKTTVALETVVAAVAEGLDPGDVLLLAATRRAAADLRDRLGARLRRTTSRPLVRTPAATAFAVLRRRAAALREPPPTLVSGPEQDVMLAELLAGQAAGEGRGVPWPGWVTPQMRALRAFRDELRDLLMRAAERGLSPAELADLGAAQGRGEWVAAAGLYAEYLDNLALRGTTPDVGDRLDPAVIVEEAAEALAAWERELPGVERPSWRLVVVDDHQESTAATARLLRAMADDGARLVLVADPDAAVQTFRGAAPELVERAAAGGGGPGAFDAHTVVLRTVWRHGAALRAAVARVTAGVGTLGSFQHRQAVSAAPEAGEPPRVAVLPNGAQEAAFVARTLREAHLVDGVPWRRMAVVARSGAVVTALRRALAGAGVPVSVAGSDVPLRDEPAVAPLLLAMSVAVGVTTLDAEVAVRLATSPLGGLDAVGLRRVRRALRADELAAGGGRTSDVLLVEALGDPARSAGLPPTLARPVGRLARILQAGRRAADEPGADAQGVLWAVWEAAGLAETWRRRALAGGVAGDRADRDLDAVLALFRAAETFVDRMPRSAPAAFVDWLAAQDLPADTIAAQGRREAVAVLTPAGAAGQEWDVVVVAGVQEGVWPDVRLRDSLLGAQALVDLLAGRASRAEAGGVAARAAVLADELRGFAVACSRARRRLVVTAVGAAEVQPSPLLDLVVPPGADDDRRVRDDRAPLDLRGLVATLRAELERSARAGVPDPDAARVLARLASQGVAGAHPAEWPGIQPPSSDAPLWGPGEQVPVSPSKIETFDRCGLRWALESAGGTPAAGGSQNLGSLIHSIAQQNPQGTREELAAALEARWRELGLAPGWQEAKERRRADEMIRRLARYVADHPAALVEAWVEVDVGRARLRGSIDRVEPTGDGRVEVVDLKTGKSKPTADEAKVHPQLGAYQLAVDAGGLDGQPGIAAGTTSAGARLVYVSDGRDGPIDRAQPALGAGPDGDSWARDLVVRTADAMAASTFTARVNDLCDRCPVRRSCPVVDEGGQVVA